MKKVKIVPMVLVFMLLLSISFPANSQDQTWFKHILNLLRPGPQYKIDVSPWQHGFHQNQEVQRLVIHNINEHLKRVARLPTSGKTDDQVWQYLTFRKKALGSGSISGTVYESNGSTPIQNYVLIEAFNKYGQHLGLARVFPEDRGAYTITGLLAGEYYVRTVTRGKYRDEYYNNATDWRKATLVPVTNGKETGNINFILDPYRGEGAISGRVTVEDGFPLRDCYIFAYDENYNLVSYGMTKDNGSYIVSELPSGKYKLELKYWESEDYIDEWYDNTQSFETATVVKVIDPKITRKINFVLEYGGFIKGKVLTALGMLVGEQDGFISAWDDEKNLIKSAYTNKRGKFTIPKLEKGNYRLRIHYTPSYFNGEENLLNCWYKKAYSFKNAKSITVKSRETKRVRINLEAAGAISGNVIDYNGQPVAWDCRIYAVKDRSDLVESDTVDGNGNYKILRLPSGRYRLYLMNFTRESMAGQKPANEWYDGEYGFDEAQLVVVNTPETTENIDFTLEKGGSIAGKVYDPEGLPLDDIGLVEAFNLQGQWISIEGFNSDGQYLLPGLLSGKYKLSLGYHGKENYSREWYDGKQNFGTANTVKVNAPKKKQNIDFTLEYFGILQGFISNPDGNCLTDEEYVIEVDAYDANTGDFIDSSTNSFVGGYQFWLLGREYKLAAVSHYYNWLAEQDCLAVTYYKAGKKFKNPKTKTISLKSNSFRKLKPLMMEKADGTISGTVYDKDTKQPMTEGFYIILAFDEDGYLVKTCGYSEFNAPISGKYKLCGLRPGHYYLLAWAWTGLISIDNYLPQWYDSVDVNINPLTIIPKMKIPTNASAMTVNTGEVSKIDFYLILNSASDN